MSIRILGGVAKGLPLQILENDHLRPTSVLLRRRIFDAHQNLDGFCFIDICAGSGSMGIEALSRGAASAIFVEQEKQFFQILKKNVESYKQKCKSNQEIILKQGSALDFFFLVGKEEREILFFDPPYEKLGLYDDLLTQLMTLDYSKTLWLEGCEQKGRKISDWEGRLSLLGRSIKKAYQQGSSYILIVEKS